MREVGGGHDRVLSHLVQVLTGWLLSLSTVASISQICCPSGKIKKGHTLKELLETKDLRPKLTNLHLSWFTHSIVSARCIRVFVLCVSI